MSPSRYIYYQGEIFRVVGIGHGPRGKELAFKVIELKYMFMMPNDNIPSMEVPVNEAIEITNDEILEMLEILYE